VRKSSRITLALSALALAAGFFLPLWSISLEAPQYPEGIGMLIEVNTISGQRPHDLDNINKLNHYIGMKSIEPDAIRELDWMPWILGFLILAGLAGAALGRRWMLFAWLGLLGAVGVAGMVDFWLWGYDYGHNLDPMAAIKVPGMTYQPPLIGSKALLNFVAYSWPALGGLIVIGAGAITGVAGFFEIRRKRRGKGISAAMVVLIGCALPLSGCAPKEPVPIRIGEESCAECLMTVSDARYATELITKKGKVYFFDSVECLAGFYLDQNADDVASMWVTDFHTQARLIPVDKAFFLRSKDLRSPMGMNLTAFGDGITPETILNSFIGEILDWPEVLALVENEGIPGAGMEGMHGGHDEGLVEGSGGG
jgi:copper chaperone NosL